MQKEQVISKRPLGKTNIQVTPIGLGMMEFAGGGKGILGPAFPVINQDEKNAIVKAALDGGINWFDTAELYGGGISEATLSAALKAAGKTDADVVVATKWWPLLRTARNIPLTIQDRIRFLDGFTISNYMVHQPYGFSSPEAEMEAMAGLVEAGKIRSVGVSNFNPQQMRRAHAALQKHGLPLAVNQVRYSLLDRTIESNGILETRRGGECMVVVVQLLATGQQPPRHQIAGGVVAFEVAVTQRVAEAIDDARRHDRHRGHLHRDDDDSRDTKQHQIGQNQRKQAQVAVARVHVALDPVIRRATAVLGCDRRIASGRLVHFGTLKQDLA